MREGAFGLFCLKKLPLRKTEYIFMAERYRLLFNYGSIGGLLAFAWFMLIYAAGFSPLGMLRLTGFWIPVLLVFLSIRRQSRAVPAEDGYLFGRAFFDGITTAFLLGALKGMLVFAFIRIAAPDIPDMNQAELQNLMAWMESHGMLLEADRQQMQKLMEEARGEGYTAWGILSSEISVYFYGAVPVSLIAALIFKKPAKQQ